MPQQITRPRPAGSDGVNLRHVRQAADATRECCARIIELCIEANRIEMASYLIRQGTTADAAARLLATPATSAPATAAQQPGSLFGPASHLARGSFDPTAAAEAARASGRLRAP
jgi:hypothetical protein